jgi:hypothetical protein
MPIAAGDFRDDPFRVVRYYACERQRFLCRLRTLSEKTSSKHRRKQSSLSGRIKLMPPLRHNRPVRAFAVKIEYIGESNSFIPRGLTMTATRLCKRAPSPSPVGTTSGSSSNMHMSQSPSQAPPPRAFSPFAVMSISTSLACLNASDNSTASGRAPTEQFITSFSSSPSDDDGGALEPSAEAASSPPR